VHRPEFALLVSAGRGVRGRHGVGMHRQREIVIGEAGEARVDDALPYVGLRDGRESGAGRTLEVSILDDFYRCIRPSHQIASCRTGIGRVGTVDCVARAGPGFARDVRERRDPNHGDNAEHPVEGFWPT
jgi:hypothetical protein